MKKFIAGVLSATLALSCLALPAEVSDKLDLGSVISASAETYGDYEYQVLDNDTVEIIRYTGNDLEVAIPDTIDGKKVTNIGESAFEYCLDITSITIPNSVTSIGDEAFECCYNITSIAIPNSVTSVGDSAFHYCESLTSITISDSITNIGREAFSHCCSFARKM